MDRKRAQATLGTRNSVLIRGVAYLRSWICTTLIGTFSSLDITEYNVLKQSKNYSSSAKKWALIGSYAHGVGECLFNSRVFSIHGALFTINPEIYVVCCHKKQ